MRIASKEEQQKHCHLIRDSRVRFDNYEPLFVVGDTVRLKGNKNSPCMVIYSFKTKLGKVPGINNTRIWNGLLICDYITNIVTNINGKEVITEEPIRAEYHVHQLESC